MPLLSLPLTTRIGCVSAAGVSSTASCLRSVVLLMNGIFNILGRVCTAFQALQNIFRVRSQSDAEMVDELQIALRVQPREQGQFGVGGTSADERSP